MNVLDAGQTCGQTCSCTSGQLRPTGVALLLLAVPSTVATAAADALSVEEIAALTGRAERTVRRLVARWEAQGFPRVTRAATDSRKWRLLVDRADFDAYCRGEIPERLYAEAA